MSTPFGFSPAAGERNLTPLPPQKASRDILGAAGNTPNVVMSDPTLDQCCCSTNFRTRVPRWALVWPQRQPASLGVFDHYLSLQHPHAGCPPSTEYGLLKHDTNKGASTTHHIAGIAAHPPTRHGGSIISGCLGVFRFTCQSRESDETSAYQLSLLHEHLMQPGADHYNACDVRFPQPLKEKASFR